MFAAFNKRELNRDFSASSYVGSGELELEITEPYISDKDAKIARLDKQSMKSLHISAGDAIILFADDRPMILKALPLFPSDRRTGLIRVGKNVRKQLNRDIGANVTVRGIGNTKIDKVVNYLLLDRYSNPRR